MKVIILAIVGLLLAGCSEAPQPENAAVALNRDFTCKEPLPTFTLGPTSNPSDAEVSALCACIWKNLGSWERRTAQLIVEKRESEISSLNRAAFPARFGAALEKCGGMKL
jgi:hypothetical protein